MSRIMIAGTGSGSGKTTITCGLCRCFQDRGLCVTALKCGPDYIDAMFHSRVLHMETGNLDSWFCSETVIKGLLAEKEKNSDLTVAEGVMGYYDGAGFTQKGSSYEIAAITHTPVILIVNCRGISTSIGAVLKGFAAFQENSRICGVIFNQLPEKLYTNAAAMAEGLGIEPLGYLPYQKEGLLESRHLGLVTAGEVAHFQDKMDKIAEQMKKSLDLDKIWRLAGSAEPLEECFLPVEKKSLRIAVAKDAAFCFLYQDNIDYLERHGCEVIHFSPLSDREVPQDVQGLLLSGGYPELYAKQLSENVTMRNSVAAAVRKGLPCIAECGGFLYLHRELEAEDGGIFPMAGVIDGRGCKTEKLQRFGYMTLRTKKDTLLAAEGEELRTHEFHYWNSDNPGVDFGIEKASDGSMVAAGYGTESVYAGFPHIYFYGNEIAAGRFLKACAAFGKQENR